LKDKAFGKKKIIGEEGYKKVLNYLKEKFLLRDEIICVYLYGTFAKKEPFHDIDLALLLDIDYSPASLLKYEISLEREVETELEKVGLRFPIDIRVLNQAPLSFRYAVIKGGFPLLVRNEDVRVNFEERTFDMYSDFAYFRKRYLREVLKK
jgi:hypothetical protein